MKFKLVLLLCIPLLFSCKTDDTSSNAEIVIYDGAIPEQIKLYGSLELDKTHPNLIDPRNSQEDNEAVTKSWLNLNQGLGKFLADNNFEWHTTSEKIQIWHKFYFHKNGQLKYYYFKVYDNQIDKNNRDKYRQLVTEFAKSYQLPLQRDSQFAQCGRGVFLNN